MKVTTIEETQYINNMKVDELIWSLLTFELGISEKSEKKKSIVFVSNTDDSKDECDLDIEEGMSNAIVLLGKQFNKELKKVEWKSRSNVKNKSSDKSFDININQDFGGRDGYFINASHMSVLKQYIRIH